MTDLKINALKAAQFVSTATPLVATAATVTAAVAKVYGHNFPQKVPAWPGIVSSTVPLLQLAFSVPQSATHDYLRNTISQRQAEAVRFATDTVFGKYLKEIRDLPGVSDQDARSRALQKAKEEITALLMSIPSNINSTLASANRQKLLLNLLSTVMSITGVILVNARTSHNGVMWSGLIGPVVGSVACAIIGFVTPGNETYRTSFDKMEREKELLIDDLDASLASHNEVFDVTRQKLLKEIETAFSSKEGTEPWYQLVLGIVCAIATGAGMYHDKNQIEAFVTNILPLCGGLILTGALACGSALSVLVGTMVDRPL